jgi:DNA-binding protein YbaB
MAWRQVCDTLSPSGYYVNGEVRVTNPEQLISGFEAKLAAARRNAGRVRAEIESVSVSEHSKDGQITVKVNHAGNLVGLEIGPVVREKPSLAQDILRTVQAAQAKLADAVQTSVPSIAGTEAMGELVGRLHSEYPEPEPWGYVEGGYAEPVNDGARFVAEDEAPIPKPPLPPRPTRPVTGDGHDDDYFGGGDFLR